MRKKFYILSLFFILPTQTNLHPTLSINESLQEKFTIVKSFSNMEKLQLLTATLRGPLGSLETWCKNHHHDLTAFAECFSLINTMSNDLSSILLNPQESPIHQIIRMCHDCCTMILVLGNYSNNDYEGHAHYLSDDDEDKLCRILPYVLSWIESFASAHSALTTNDHSSKAHKERCLAQGILSLAHYSKAYLQERDNRTLAHYRLALILGSCGLLTYHYSQDEDTFDTINQFLTPIEFREKFKDIESSLRREWRECHRDSLQKEFTKKGFSSENLKAILQQYENSIEPLLDNISAILERAPIDTKSLKEKVDEFAKAFDNFKKINKDAPENITYLFKHIDELLAFSIRASI